VAVARRDQQAAAIGRIDVQPDAVVLAQRGDLRQRVDAAEVGGAGGGDHGHGQLAQALTVRQRLGQRRHAHALGTVGFDAAHGVVAQPQQRGGFLHAEVAGAGGEDAQSARVRR